MLAVRRSPINGIGIADVLNSTVIFDGVTYLWLDNGCSFSSGATAPLYIASIVYITNCSLPDNRVSFIPFSGATLMQPALIRGNTCSVQNATTELLIEIYTVLGNAWTTTAETLLENNVTTSVNATSVMPIIAFNTVYKENGANNGASLIQLNELIGSTIGAAAVQNLFESIAPNSNTALLYLSADESSGTPNNNHITWLNTMIGGPIKYS